MPGQDRDGQFTKSLVNPQEVVEIKVAIAQGEKFPAMGWLKFAHLGYQALNKELFNALEDSGKLPKIKFTCLVCPNGHEHGMMGFAVDLGKEETKRGRSTLIQHEIKFAGMTGGVKPTLEVTFLTITDGPLNDGRTGIAFVIGGPIGVEPTAHG